VGIVQSWGRALASSVVASCAAAACATEPDLAVTRDLAAPFQTSALDYAFADHGDAWWAAITFQYTNSGSLTVRLDPCGTVVQRRDGGAWHTVLTTICPQAALVSTDSIPADASVTFPFVLQTPHDPNTFPRLPEPLSGIYRLVFGLRERHTPNPGLVVWQTVTDLERRRSNEFAVSLPH
jgi:hypothetical protein